MDLTMQIRLLDETLPNTAPRLFDPVSGILFWDEQPKVYYDLYRTMRGFFWVPEEVSLQQDGTDWVNNMDENEHELFLDGISVLASLDTVAAVFDDFAAKYIRNPAVKQMMGYVGSTESIHNESYTYILMSMISKAQSKEVFDRPKTNPILVKRNRLMMDIFDDFIKDQTLMNFVKAIVAMSALEGICFTNGFTPFYHFNRNQKMFGSGTIIQFIQRDEAQHSYFQTVLVRDIMTQYPELNKEELVQFIYDFFREIVKLEQDFSKYLYRNTPDMDIVEVEMYVEYRANLILDNLGLDKIFEPKKNPMRWITAYDPDNLNGVKRDFFEDKELNYVKASDDNDWDDL